jgi:hypothetical protein
MSSRPRARTTQPRRRPKPPRIELWSTPDPLPDVERVTVAQEVGALLTSLGDPPFNGGVKAAPYFTKVVERAAAVALGLALSAELLAEPGDG